MAEGKCGFCSRITKYKCSSCTNMVCVVCGDEVNENDEGYDEENHQVVKCPNGNCVRAGTEKGKSSSKQKTAASGKKTILSFFGSKSSSGQTKRGAPVSDDSDLMKSKKKKLSGTFRGEGAKLDETVYSPDTIELNQNDPIESHRISMPVASDIDQEGQTQCDLSTDNIKQKDQIQRDKILIEFQKHFPNISSDKIHNYYFCHDRKCSEICSNDLRTMSKDKKFQHNWLFNPEYAYCNHSELWSLVYIDGHGMFCALCRRFDAKQKKNGVKQWNCIPNVRYRTETVKCHLSSDMHNDSVEADKRLRTSYFDAEEDKKYPI